MEFPQIEAVQGTVYASLDGHYFRLENVGGITKTEDEWIHIWPYMLSQQVFDDLDCRCSIVFNFEILR